MRVWCPVTEGGLGGALKLTLEGHNGSVLSLAIHPRNNNIISGSSDESAIIWNGIGDLLYRWPRTLLTLPSHTALALCFSLYPFTLLTRSHCSLYPLALLTLPSHSA